MGITDIPQYVVAEVSGGSTNPQEILSSAIEKQRQIIIEGMKQNLINLGYSQEKISTFKFDVVGNIGVIINSKGNVNSLYKYSNGKVEFYINFPGLQKSGDFQYVLGETGYEFKDGKLSKNGKEISQFLQNGSVNPEFIKAIDTMNLFDDMPVIFGGMKAIQNGKTLEEFNIGYFERTIIGGLSRIKEVMYFYSKGYIPQEDFERLLVRAIQELPNQCSDTRLYKTPKGERMGMEVRKSELDEYLKPTKGEPLITQKMYDDCLRRIELRDRKIQEEEKIKSGARGELKTEGTKLGFNQQLLGVTGIG